VPSRPVDVAIDLTDPDLFSSNEFWGVLAWLRANDPVYRHGDFWVLSRHRDIVAAYADPELFSSRQGMRLDSNAEAVAAVSQQMLIVSDSPQHTRLKRVLAQLFSASEVARLDQLVSDVVRDVLAGAVAAGTVDFIDVAKQIPNRVVCAMMGIPREDWEWIGALTTDAFDSDDDNERSGAHAEIFLYFTDLLRQRREQPGTDLVSRIALDHLPADANGDARPLTDAEIVFNCNGILAGANETTRYSAAGGLLALIENPDQWQRLRDLGPAGVPDAVEEILRWTTPGVHAMRTAQRPTTIAGVPIAAGDRVTLWNASANRDEAMFVDADQFRVDRDPNRHVTFGHGRHLCLGARLARLELSAYLTELLERVERAELTGPAQFNSSNFTWGVRSLPVRLFARAAPPRPGAGTRSR
jgi:cytochrome P450